MALRWSITLTESEVKALLLMVKAVSDEDWAHAETKQALANLGERIQIATENQMPHLKNFVADKGGLGDF